MAGAQPVKGTEVEGEVPLEATDPLALADPDTVQVPKPQETEPTVLRQDPYIHFGERIIVRQGVGGETFITKPYSMPSSKGEKLVQLMDALEPFPFRLRG